MKKLSLVLCCATLMAVACKKDANITTDEKPIIPANTFSLEGKSYASDYAYWTGSDGLVITNLPKAPEYIENSVQIFVDSLYFSNQFDYMGRNSTGYDRKKHFFNAVVRYTASGIYGSGQEITGVTTGTMHVGCSDGIFTIDYKLTVAGRPIEGRYEGKVEGKKAN